MSVTVTVDDVPPTTALGESVKSPSSAGVIVKFAFLELEPNFPVIVAMLLVDTPVVENKKFAVVLPDGTTTLLGSVTTLLVDVNATVAPVGGAMPVSFTVPIDRSPPTTDVGERVIELRAAADTVRLVDFAVLLAEAVSFADWVLVTPMVET